MRLRAAPRSGQGPESGTQGVGPPPHAASPPTGRVLPDAPPAKGKPACERVCVSVYARMCVHASTRVCEHMRVSVRVVRHVGMYVGGGARMRIKEKNTREARPDVFKKLNRPQRNSPLRPQREVLREQQRGKEEREGPEDPRPAGPTHSSLHTEHAPVPRSSLRAGRPKTAPRVGEGDTGPRPGWPHRRSSSEENPQGDHHGLRALGLAVSPVGAPARRGGAGEADGVVPQWMAATGGPFDSRGAEYAGLRGLHAREPRPPAP